MTVDDYCGLQWMAMVQKDCVGLWMRVNVCVALGFEFLGKSPVVRPVTWSKVVTRRLFPVLGLGARVDHCLKKGRDGR